MSEVVLVAAEGWEIRHAPGQYRRVVTGVGRCLDDVEGGIVVNAGVCGALDPSLLPGDIVIATTVNGIAVRQPARAPVAVTGAVLTVDRIIATAQEKRRLRAETGAIAVDMEAARILPRVRGGQFCCIKVVLDTADEAFVLDLNSAVVDGRFSRAVIACQFLRRPLKIGSELLRLKRRRDYAARALGEFVGKCSF